MPRSRNSAGAMRCAQCGYELWLIREGLIERRRDERRRRWKVSHPELFE